MQSYTCALDSSILYGAHCPNELYFQTSGTPTRRQNLSSTLGSCAFGKMGPDG
jgi:hypothetical protein